MSSHDSGTYAPDAAAEESSSLGAGHQNIQSIWLQPASLCSMGGPPYWQCHDIAPRASASPQGVTSNTRLVMSNPHFVKLHAFTAAPGASLRPVSGGQGGWPVESGTRVDPMAVDRLLGRGMSTRPSAAATAAGAFAMPNAGIGGCLSMCCPP
jgi:hypothetical protein